MMTVAHEGLRILFCGDVVGRCGREAVQQWVPKLRAALSLDFVVVNGENAASGFGITSDICRDFHRAGVDVITTGNHVWDQRTFAFEIKQQPRTLRPLNLPPEAPGVGIVDVVLESGSKVAVINVLTRLFMDMVDDPFRALDTVLADRVLGKTHAAILVDVHGEATSEKMALGHFLDGRVSLVVGSHTHVPTHDARCLPRGTGYITDAGMCGDYNSVVGMEAAIAVQRFLRRAPTERLKPAAGPATLCGILATLDLSSGLARTLRPVQLGAPLAFTNLPPLFDL